MANIKVSEMTQADSVNDIDLLMIVQGSTNKKVTKQTLMKNINTEITNIKSEQATQNTKIQANTTAIETKASQSDLDAVEADIQTNRANITALQTENNNLRKALPNIKGTGTDITLNNTSENKFNELVVKGNTEQDSYTGKNMFNLTAQDFKNGTIVGFASKVFLGGLKPNTTYICSTNDTAQLGSSTTNLLFGGANSTTNGVNISSPKTATSNENGEVEVLLRTTNIDNFLNNYWVQIEEGSTATSYEPYCGRYSSTKSTVINVLLKMLQVM